MREVKLEVVQTFYDNDQIGIEEYWLNGLFHNENGPSFREWYENGKICCEEYCLNGKSHNENGPAHRSWDENGQIICELYWINGKEFSKKDFENRNNPCAGKKVVVDGKEYALTPV